VLAPSSSEIEEQEQQCAIGDLAREHVPLGDQADLDDRNSRNAQRQDHDGESVLVAVVYFRSESRSKAGSDMLRAGHSGNEVRHSDAYRQPDRDRQRGGDREQGSQPGARPPHEDQDLALEQHETEHHECHDAEGLRRRVITAVGDRVPNRLGQETGQAGTL
jgi:hypothetical protein